MLWSISCGRPPIGDDHGGRADEAVADIDDDDDASTPAGDEDSPACEGPYCSDPANCGAAGVQCPHTFSEAGTCDRGRCATASYCINEVYDPPPGFNCATACRNTGEGGATCLERGCAGHTAYVWPDRETCHGYWAELSALELGCEEPIDFAALDGLSMRCCCVGP